MNMHMHVHCIFMYIHAKSMYIAYSCTMSCMSSQCTNRHACMQHSHCHDVMFACTELTGALFTNTTLDRETTPAYTLTVMVSDPTFSTNGTIIVTIADINDNTPAFIMLTYSVGIIENPPNGSLVRMVQARDPDMGNNGSLVYSIISGNLQDAFRIDPTFGNVIVESPDVFDFETTQSFFLQIGVQDMGTPPLSAQAAVRSHTLRLFISYIH